MDDDLHTTITELLSLLTIVLLLSGPPWMFALRRKLRGEPFLKFEPRRHVPWGLVDLALVVVLTVLVTMAAGALLSSVWQIDRTVKLQDMPADDRAAVLLASSIASLVAAIIAYLSIKAKTLATRTDFGFRWTSVRRDLSIGAMAFFMLAPPVILLQAVLTTVWKKSEHPLIELIVEQPDVKFFVISGFSAIIVAPVVEEFLFRGVLQGWLEKIPGYRQDSGKLIVGERLEQPRIATEAGVMENTGAGAEFSDNPYVPPRSDTKPTNAIGIHDDNLAGPTTWPILVSALAFALMHFSHGPDPIPLFFLALGIGYLYQRTHSLLPCIVVHFLLNSVSLVLLLIQVYA